MPAHFLSAGLGLEPKYRLVSEGPSSTLVSLCPTSGGRRVCKRLSPRNFCVLMSKRWQCQPHTVGSKLPKAHVCGHIWHAESVPESPLGTSPAGQRAGSEQKLGEQPGGVGASVSASVCSPGPSQPTATLSLHWGWRGHERPCW